MPESFSHVISLTSLRFKGCNPIFLDAGEIESFLLGLCFTLPRRSMAERVHPAQIPEKGVRLESPRLSASSAEANLPVRKPSPPEPATHAIGVSSSRRHRGRRRCFLCLGVVIFFLAATAGVVFLVVHPRVPRYSIDGVSISSFVLTAFTVSPVLSVTVIADNRRNKRIGIYYRDGSDITAVYDGVTLCDGRWPEFYHPPHNETRFITDLMGSAIRLTAAMQEALTAALTQRKVPLEVNVGVPVRIKLGAVTSWTIKVRVRCEVTVDSLRENAVVVDRRCRAKVKIFG